MNLSAQMSEQNMISAACDFLSALDKNQKRKASFEFDDEERKNWHYYPRIRNGISLHELNDDQLQKAQALLKSGLSVKGFDKSMGIPKLESILSVIEGRDAHDTYRDPRAYFLSVFGKPSDAKPWGWRFEGHHISLNYTSVENEISVSPAFFGANPAIVPDGKYKDMAVLDNEQTLGRALAQSMDTDQRKKAFVYNYVPGEIFTGADVKIDPGVPKGIPYGELQPQQQRLMMKLLNVYLGNMSREIAASQLAQVEAAGVDRLHFSWAGEIEPGHGHYYAIHGPTLLIEYDNTQHNANHIHSVWRDLKNDFGEDLLRKHYHMTH